MDLSEFKATLSRNRHRWWWFPPLTPVLGNRMRIIPALKGTIRQEEKEAQGSVCSHQTAGRGKTFLVT